MNLKKVQFEDRDIQFIKDNGAEAYLTKVFSGVKITDNRWKEYEGSTALFEFVDENGIDFKSFCKYIDHKFPKQVKKWISKFGNYIEGDSDTLVGLGENGSCEDVVDALDAVMSDAEKSKVIKSYSAGV